MRKFLFLLTATATLVLVDAARAQYLPPTLGGTAIAPGYTVPGYTAPGNTAPGYNWREQRANEDWRNNTWREQRLNEDWRNNNWRQQRANEDWQHREDYSKTTTPNNAIDRGYVGTGTAPKTATETKNNPQQDVTGTKPNPLIKPEDCGVTVSRLATTCQNYAKDKTSTNAINKTNTNAINRGYDPKAYTSPVR